MPRPETAVPTTSTAEGRVRWRVPLTVRVRGELSDDRLVDLSDGVTRAVGRALEQGMTRVRERGLRLFTTPSTRLTVTDPTFTAREGAIELAPLEIAVRRGLERGLSTAPDSLGAVPGIELARWRPGADLARQRARAEQALDPPALAFLTPDTLYEAIAAFFPDPRPRGNTFHGVYGIWIEDMTPRLIWISGHAREGARQALPVFEWLQLVHGRRVDGRWVPEGAGNVPSAVALGARYRLDVLIEPRTERRVPYHATMREEPGGRRRPVFLAAAEHRRLRGKVIRFGVASELVEEIVVVAQRAAPPSPPQAPPWEWYWRSSSLPAEPDSGIPPFLWYWYGWFNVRPAEVRADPLIRAIFEQWERSGEAERVNLLFLHLHYARLYRLFCQRVALEMLDISRQNMRGFLAVLDRPEWAERFRTLIQWLEEPAALLEDIRRLPQLRQELEQLEARYRLEQEAGPPEHGAPVSGEMLRTQRERIARAEAAGQRETERLEALFEVSREMEPLLVLLTIREGQTVDTIEGSIARLWGTHPEPLLRHIRDQIRFLIEKTIEAEGEIRGDADVAYRLQFVQEVANRRLAAWLQANRPFAEAVERLIAGPGLLAWLGLGLGLLILTFVFPPAGLALSAGVGVFQAYGSVRDALQLARLSRVRIAQAGFRPLVSQQELEAAVFQAALDVFFALLDVGALAGATGRAIRTTLRGRGLERAVGEASGALGRSLERMVVGLRRLDLWPAELTQSVRRRVIEQLDLARPGWRDGVADTVRYVDEVTETVQREMVLRYEQRLLSFQREFEQALRGGVAVGDLQTWLLRQFPQPREFLEELARRELVRGSSLFEDTIGRRLAGLPTLPTRQAIAALGEVSQAELEAVARELGPLAQVLTPNRLHGLGVSTELGYPDLARRLQGILSRVAEAEHDNVVRHLETLLVGRRDARQFLDVLERAANPRPILEALTPRMLDAPLAGGFDELFEAISRTPSRGRVIGYLTDLDARGVRRLFREVEGEGGRRAFERWDGLADGWRPEPRIRVVEPPPVQRAVAEAERAAALSRLEELAGARTAAGRPTAAAERLSTVRRLIEAQPTGQQFLAEIGSLAAREGSDVAAGLLRGLSFLEGGPTARELEAVADFVRRGGEGRALSEIVARAERQAYLQPRIRGFLDALPSFRDGDLRGVSVVLAERGYAREGAEAVLRIHGNFGDPRPVFGALNDLAPHSRGLNRVIGYLASGTQNLNQAALGQLFAARRLLEEFPDARLVFEVPVERAGRVIREIDIQVVTARTGVPLLEVELKEVTNLFPLGTEHVRQQFARDIVRSVQAARATEAPLGRIRWLIREQELVAQYGSREAVRTQVRDLLRKAFEHDEVVQALRPEQRAAALRWFDDNFDRIVQLF
jgi:hypothetical protein